jgi:hypothetical protein
MCQTLDLRFLLFDCLFVIFFFIFALFLPSLLLHFPLFLFGFCIALLSTPPPPSFVSVFQLMWVSVAYPNLR